MRQLTFIEPGKLEWWDVAAPRIEDRQQALVRPMYVARCDLDVGIMSGKAGLPGPFATGHECIGVVTEVGDGVQGFRPGDIVSIPFQISCGTCDHCRKGWTNSCLNVPRGAVYGMKPLCGVEFGGALSELVLVPFADAMLVAVPDGVAPEVLASGADNVVDGWRAVAEPLKRNPGANVLVAGGEGKSVGLYAAASAVSLGAGRVLFAHRDPAVLRLAKEVGADVMELKGAASSHKTLGSFPITVDASGEADVLQLVIRSTSACGTCTSVAIYFEDEVPVPMLRMYTKGITFITERVQARALMPEMFDHVACGHLHPEKITEKIVGFSDAADAMDDPCAKIVFSNDWT